LRKLIVDYAAFSAVLYRRGESFQVWPLLPAIRSDKAREGDAAMPENATKTPPTKAPCWPDDPDWLDGPTEIFLPSSKYLKACWDADILDIDDKNVEDTIIERKEEFKVRFRVQLEGRLWKCVAGHWCFDVCFTAIGDGEDFNLSDVLPDDLKPKLKICDWTGCQTRCIYVCLTVPKDTIPAGCCGTLYDVGAKFELRCCGDCDFDCDDNGDNGDGDDGNGGNGNGDGKGKGKSPGHLAVAGHEHQGEYMFV
jgi:hypothetical protein